MRIVFSRKGFDSAAGGVPNPIVDGVPIALPIPQREPGVVRFGDLPPPLPGLIDDLTRGRIAGDEYCHADPDLGGGPCAALADARTAAPGRAGFRGVLGQHGAAQGHLRNQHVGVGDLFLFFGLFQAVAKVGGGWQRTGKPQHRLFGWLQVGRVVALGAGRSEIVDELLEAQPWLERHPHLRGDWGPGNTLYLARSRLRVGNRAWPQPGWGRFRRGVPLTAAGAANVSCWRLPEWLNPNLGGTGLSYHAHSRWREDGLLAAAARGQEFVADIGARADAIAWLQELFRADGPATS